MKVCDHVLLGLAPPGGVQAEQAGGEDAELEEDDESPSSDDDWPGGADNLFILSYSPDKTWQVLISNENPITLPLTTILTRLLPGTSEPVHLCPGLHIDLLGQRSVAVQNLLAKVFIEHQPTGE